MSKALREEKSNLYKEIRKLADLSNDPKHTWTPENQANWDKLNKDFDACSEKLERAERADSTQKEVERTSEERKIGREDRDYRKPGVGGLVLDEDYDQQAEDREDDDEPEESDGENPFAGKKNEIRAKRVEDFALSLQAWCRFHQFGLTKRHIEACRRTGLNPRRPYIDLPMRRGLFRGRDLVKEFRAPMSTSAGSGGETIPEGFVNAFERSMLDFSGVRQVAGILRTATGNPLPWPTSDDTANKGELLAENTAAAEQHVATGAVVFGAFKYSSKLVKVSVELLQDSAFDLPSMMGEILGERLGRILNDHFTVGTGSGQPNGIVTASSVGATLATGQTTSFNATDGVDKIIALLHSVDPAYRTGPGAGFMMHDTTLSALRKIKDSQNRLLFNADLQSGIPDRLLGFPISINQSMAVPAANAKTILFGDLSKYKIRDVASVRLRRLVERFAELDQECFIAFSRHDGDLLDAGTDPVKHLAMSAT